MLQLQAGYLLDGIRTSILNERTDNLLKQLSFFEVSSQLTAGTPSILADDDPIVAIAHNLLMRGLPTRPSLLIEESFLKAFDLLGKQIDDTGHIRYTCQNVAPLTELLYQATHIIDPRQSIDATALEGLFKTNYYEPIYESELGLSSLELMLAPFAIARIQKVLLHLIQGQILSLEESVWRILVIEQDVPCARLAFDDFKDWFGRLLALEGKGRELPKILLEVYNTPEFESAKLNQLHTSKSWKIYQLKKATATFDVLIDVATLQKHNGKSASFNEYAITVPNKVVIRSTTNIRSTRAFQTGDLHTYNFKEASTKTPILQAFLKDIFRKNDFQEGQISLLQSILSLQNAIGLMPPNYGKSLIYQLAALLQPGICIIIQPLAALMQDQIHLLKQNGIDATIAINRNLKTTNNKLKAYNAVADKAVLFTFIDPEQLKNQQFRQYLLQMKQSGHYFSYGVVDEAHCISEWGHDFRLSYFHIGKNLKQYCLTANQKALPLIGLTATASYNTLIDIMEELDVNDDHLVDIHAFEQPHIQYQIIPVKPFLTGSGHVNHTIHTLAGIKQPIGEAKQHKVIALLKQIYKQPAKEKALIFCPEKFWKFGVTGIRGLAPMLRSYFDTRPIGTYIANSDEDDALSAKDLQESENSRELFAEGKISTLVSTYELGVGIHHPDIRHAIFFNMPNSIESFIQGAGRTGRDRQQADCAILYNNHPINYQESFVNSDQHGRFLLDSQTTNTTVDKRILQNNLRKRFRGLYPEMQVIKELLHEITYPLDKPLQNIADLVEDAYGVQISISLFRNNQITRMYVNQGLGQSYGFIDLTNKMINTAYANFDRTLGNELLQFMLEQIEENAPYGVDIYEWLNTEIKRPPQKGILASLEDTYEGDTMQIKIQFKNDRIAYITNLLQEEVDEQINEKVVEKVFKAAVEPDALLETLTRACMQDFNTKIIIPEDLFSKLIQHFQQIRTKTETLKAIKRLESIGLVEDFLIRSSDKSVTITIRKQKDQVYIDALHEYLCRYISPEEAREQLQFVKTLPFKHVIENAAFHLLQFIYQEIVPQRYENINLMEKVCEKGLKENSSETIATFTDLYFYAKYACKDFKPNIPDDTNQLKYFPYGLIERYIKETGNRKENWLHLVNSCIRLRKINDHYVLKILQAYAMLLLSYRNMHKRKVAEQLLLDGFVAMRNHEGSSDDQIINKHQHLISKITERNQQVLEFVEPEALNLVLKKHSHWLKAFNNDFLVGYPDA